MNRFPTIFLSIWLIALFIGGTSGSALADIHSAILDHPHPHKKVILLLVNRLGFHDLVSEDMPHVQEWAKRSALGLMNSNTGGAKNDVNTYLTLALGVPTTTKKPPQIYNPEERTGEGLTAHLLYEERTGQTAAGPILVNTPDFRHALEKLPYASSLGLTGNEWERRGIRTVVIGGMDEGQTVKRYGAMFAIDGKGRIPLGSMISKDVLIADPARPFGLRMDVTKVSDILGKTLESHDVTIIDAGDLSRLDAYRKQLTRNQFEQLRRKVLRETDQLIDLCLREANAETLVMMVTPRVSEESVSRAEWLAPLIMRGGAVKQASLLTSPTTRREGIVSNLDVAPTVLWHLGIPSPPQMLGHPMQGIQTEYPLDKTNVLALQTARTFSLRPKVMVGFGIFSLCVLLFFVFRAWIGMQVVSLILAECLGFSLLAGPLIWLLLPLFPATSWQGAFVAGGLMLAAVLAGISLFRSCYLRLAALSLLTAAVVVADVGTGGHLAAQSILSYDPIVGARYYGIGNEYMGYTLGTVLLSFGCLLEAFPQRRKAITVTFAGFFLFLLYFFASPRLGTNAGGALTAAAAFSVTLFLLKKKRWTLAGWGVLSLSMLAALVILLVFNHPDLALPTHISQAARTVWQQGSGEMERTILRKLLTSWRVINWTFLGPVFIVLLSLFLIFLSLRNSVKERVRREFPFLYISVTGITSGACVGLCVNDSGIVVAVMMMMLVIFPACMILSRRSLERLE
ncbi:hypothetical protein DNHGIG_18530 [Collibacillus ludicampi]|uniref:Alkaline phosphatase n=1 Tax=Collibacillus ludicampi TaxID=2771369 RepID=A0AAV4LEP4_9BACL|nr:hypothetical protein [Collibacillus ludicampi]GIM46304.1 hypothetical protein DNHGIG_18530 [Collibacillus ludicampi]